MEFKTKYFHFEKSNQCETFMKIINSRYKITNTCCYSNDDKGYKGFGVDSLFETQVRILYNEFIENLKKTKPKPISNKLNIKNDKSDNDVCCICLENCDYRTFCKHTLCNECLHKGESMYNIKLCPVCRKNLIAL